MKINEIKALHKKYAPNEESFKLVYDHCEIVALIVKECGERYQQNPVDIEAAWLAAMLHDIGAYTLFIPELKKFKKDAYQQHALIGAVLLEGEGLPALVINAVKTHVRMGLTAKEIKDEKLKLPYLDLEPTTIEAELLCYADRFHTKYPHFYHPKTYLKELEKYSPGQKKKFKQAMEKFGLPDLDALIAKYNHPIRQVVVK